MFFKRKIWNDGAPFEDFMGRDGAPPVARRHLAHGGGKGGSGGTTYQTQKTEIPPEVRARYDAINARAEQVAQQPFTPYGGQFVAPLTATQQQGIQQIGQAGQSYQPYQQAATTALTGGAEAGLPFYGQAAGNIAQAQGAGQPYTGLATQAGLAGTQAIAPQALNIGAYQNPYIQSVVDPTMAALRQQQQMEQSQLMGQQAMRGAFGGDRGSIAAANLARQQGLASAQTEAGLRSQGFQQALQAAQQQQGVGLGAAQANRAALQQFSPQALAIGQQAFQQPMAAAQAQQQLGQGLLGYGQNVAQGLSGLGQQGAQLGLATGQAQLGAGTLEQQTQQQLNSAFYNQFQQQQGYPFQVAQFLANIGMGTGPLYGSTTTGVTGQPTPFFSDERVKEDITEIGRTHDGQKIIKFKYKGSDQPQIGLSAQDVEKHHPEAVSETPEGIKAVDYDAATKQAERAYGGGLMPSSEGGAVHPSMAGLGFAAGGTPGVDDYSRELLQGMADPSHKTTPFGGGLPGGKQPWRVATARPAQILGSGVQLKAPAQRPTGLSEVMGGVKDAVGAVETGEKLYKGGEKAYNWAKEQAVGAPARPAVPATGNTPAQPATAATPGLFGSGGKFNPSTPQAAPSISAAPPQAPGLGAAAPQQTAEAATGLTTPEITTASLDALPTEDVASLGEGLSMFAARGGRIGYNPGGLVGSNPALPYTGGDDDKSIVEDLADDPQKQARLDAPKLDMRSGAGGGQQKDKTASTAMKLAGLGASFIPGVGPAIGAGLNMASGFVARGGSVDAAMMADAKRRIAGIESGGRYDALGPMVGGDRAHGKYQVMGANLPSWTQEALGRRMTPEEFLKSPEAQERVFEHHFGKYLGQHGNLADAASMWHSGVPLSEARRQGRRDVNMSTEDYVRKIMGGAPPAEAHMRAEMPEPRHAGLAPRPSVDDEEPMGLAPVDTGDDFEMFNNFEMPDRFNRFASGGLVSRHGYQDGGEPTLPPFELPGAETDRYMPLSNAEEDLQRGVREAPFGLAPGISENDLQRSLQRGVREAPYAQPTGIGGLNLPQHQPGTLDEHAREGMEAERLNRSWRGEYDTPGAMPAAASPPAPAGGGAPPTPAAPRAGLAPPMPAPTHVSGGAPTPPSVPLAPSGTPNPLSLANEPKLAERNFFDRAGDWLGNNQSWLLPAVGGIGKMLASRSPYFLNAAGEGLAEAAQTGLGASFKQQGLDIQQQTADIAAARQLYGVYSDLGMRIANSQGVPGVDLDPLQKQHQNLAKQINALIGKYVKSPQQAVELLTGGAGGPSSGGAPTPVTPAGGAQPSPVADQSDVPAWARQAQTTDQQKAWIKANIDPMQDPDVLRQRAAAAAVTDPRGENVTRLLAEATRIQNMINAEGTVPTKNGLAALPGFSENRSQVERTGDNTKWLNTYEPRQTEVTTRLATIDQLTKALQEVQSGPAAGTINKYTSLIAQLAGVDVNTMLSNPQAYAKARKDAYALINASFGATGTRTDMQLGAQIDASANPDLPPLANKAIIAQLKAKAEWSQERDKWLHAQLVKYGTHIDRGGAAQEWGAKHEADLIKRTGEAYRNTAILGDINDALDRQGRPIPSKLTEGQRYMAPTGNGQFAEARYMGINPQTGKTRWE